MEPPFGTLSQHMNFIKHPKRPLFLIIFLLSLPLVSKAQKKHRVKLCDKGTRVDFQEAPTTRPGPDSTMVYMTLNDSTLSTAFCSFLHLDDSLPSDSVDKINGIDANVYMFCKQQGGIPDSASTSRKKGMTVIDFNYESNVFFAETAILYGKWIYLDNGQFLVLQFGCLKSKEKLISKQRRKFFDSFRHKP